MVVDIEKEFLAFYKDDVLLRDVENALAKYRILKSLNELEKDKFKILNISPFFWGQVLDALNTDVVISTSRLYDVDKNFKPRSHINIPNFLKFIKENFTVLFSKECVWKRNEIFSGKDWKAGQIPLLEFSKVELDCLMLEENKEKILTLMFYRDKSYAHSDRDFARNRKEIVKEKVIKNNEIENLIVMAYDFLKSYRLSFDGSNYAFPVANLNDFDSTIDILYAYLNPKN
jgi:hypothetical protein